MKKSEQAKKLTERIDEVMNLRSGEFDEVKLIVETFLEEIEEIPNDDVQGVIECFKSITGQIKTKGTSSVRSMIKQRLKDYGKEDVCSVIQLKYDEWKDDAMMKKYIRLETLMNATKFESYVNEIGNQYKYPAEWSKDHQDRLTPFEMQEWWKELRERGLHPVKNDSGRIIKWMPILGS